MAGAKLSDGTLATFVADASGHGLAAALVIAQVRAVLRALSEIQSDPSRFQSVPAPAVPLGVSNDLITDSPMPVRLQPGGMLVVMTDGIFEAPNEAGEFFGAARVGDLLDQLEDEPAETIVRRLRDAVRVWQGRDEPADDQTILVVRRPA